MPFNRAPLDPVRWDDDAVRLIDQRLLPGTLHYWHCRTVEAVADAIRTLAVRGAPAIGIAAAFGVALGASIANREGKDPVAAARKASALLRTTRPTAVNLFWALDRMNRVIASGSGSASTLFAALLTEAQAILDEDLATGAAIAEAGLSIFPAGATRVLTHCNAGGLATGGWGTALAPMYAAAASGRALRVLADETRPLLQGARLTAWEMARIGVEVDVLVDGAAASVLARGGADLVIVGADRIAVNGDSANKIGTYGVALAAREAGVPFYIAAPRSTFDPDVATGADIPVEERGKDEVLGIHAQPGVGAMNPAFDVTPAKFIAGWITELGILQPPFTRERLFPGSK